MIGAARRFDVDAYADLIRFQAEFRLDELRREAAQERLARSVSRKQRRSLGFGRLLRRRSPARVRPMFDLPTVEVAEEPVRRVA
jgi:hypothetical protein